MFRVEEQNNGNNDRGTAFIQYLGVDRNNVRQMLQLGDSITPISEKQYTWNDIFGKTATIDIQQYVKKKTENIKLLLEEKSRELLHEVDSHFVPELKRLKDPELIELLLEREQCNSLYKLIEKEKEQDYDYLIEMSKTTHSVMLEEESQARNAKRGFWGHREEKVANLLSSVDVYVQQVYEIYRCQTIEQFYQNVLDRIKDVSMEDVNNN